MRIQKFESLTNQPRYLKDKFIIFPRSKVHIDFARKILKRYDISEVEGYMDDAFLVKTTLDIVESVIGDYPEFFESYSRVDINLEEAWSGCEEAIESIRELQDSLGNLNKWGKTKMPKNWNANIDEIINILQKMKIG